MAKRAEKRVKTDKRPLEKIKEIKSKIKEIKILDSNKINSKQDESLLEKEIEEKDLIFDQTSAALPPSASHSSIESNITLRPTTQVPQLEEALPLEQTQFRREDQRNFSQTIAYTQQTPYQRNTEQSTYQSSAASAPQERSADQDEMMESVQTSMVQRSTQDFVTLLPTNEPIVKLRSEIERPRLQREMQESRSRYSYKEKTIDESNTQRRRRDMF